jgi:hypothetical protein
MHMKHLVSSVWRRLATPGISRSRKLLVQACLAVVGVVLLIAPLLQASMAPRTEEPVRTDAPVLGLTFSQRQAEYLALPWREVYDAALDLSPSIIRLGAYWDEIEPQEGRYDWSTLDTELASADQRGLDVVLTVGMKAPRWPEYFLPSWFEQQLDLDPSAMVSENVEVRERTLTFIEQVVRRYRDHRAVEYWQVENEPLDSAGPHDWQIGSDFLAQEVALVRQLDDRPVIVTMFVEVNPMLLAPWQQRELGARAATILSMADILGLDLYPSRGFRAHGGDWYFSWPAWMWEPTVVALRWLAEDMGRRAWIMEAQAEPWEPERLVYTDAPLSRSVNPAGAATVVQQLHAAGFDTILLWGVEHWYMRRERHQDLVWWNQMLMFFPLASSSTSPHAIV